MAASMLKNYGRVCKHLTKVDGSCLTQQIRTKFIQRYRGLPPELAKTWKQKKEEIERIPPEENMAVNIGLVSNAANPKLTRKCLRKMKTERNLEELERKSRLNELEIPIEEMKEQDFEGGGQQRIHSLASHYGIFRDLFGDAYFYPKVNLKVGYSIEGEEDMVDPVFHGNTLLPEETSRAPCVHYKGEPDKLYTLCMTAPDSHLENNSKEYLHWMVCNIPGSFVDAGKTVSDYLPIFPVHGTGYHRYVFILYQQDQPVFFSIQQTSRNSTSLAERTFDTLEFYRKYQKVITPVGVCFFQAEWDQSVRNVFHNVLDMNEPRFEFLPPAEAVPKQELWPIREPFNVYLDRYRDVKDIGEEVLREKLRTADPFKPRTLPRKFPNVYTLPKDTPSWLRMKIHEQKLRKSYWKDLDD
ncbi:39S ribosomal protein L38, mitochondrial-like [Mercenaria mercenaria]|uniref:39S ribosomal protein L38, mitochondrial-like n=1 Tax=Mercenaria mercenaria TaxID=6596 RepID=UPI00234F841C|nr:39S ribosomal protein L38, mitochondrial-like [Mercenaria mercenaria]